MIIKKKLRDLSKEDYEKWKEEICGTDKVCGKIYCKDCIFNPINCCCCGDLNWVDNKDFYSDKFLNQEIEIDIPILDQEEKEYLSAVIKPFINNVTDIAKYRRTSDSREYIVINFKDTEGLILPRFQENTMYKGMELDRKYTLADLGLFQENTKITLTEFWNSKKKLAIHCDTKEKAKQLLKAFDKMGKTWSAGASYLEYIYWNSYKQNTCYNNNNGYCSIDWCKEEDYKIYEFDDVDFEKLEK